MADHVRRPPSPISRASWMPPPRSAAPGRSPEARDPFVDLWTSTSTRCFSRACRSTGWLRFEFVPESEEDGVLTVVMTDPTTSYGATARSPGQRRLRMKVGSRAAVQEVLRAGPSRRSGSSRRRRRVPDPGRPGGREGPGGPDDRPDRGRRTRSSSSSTRYYFDAVQRRPSTSTSRRRRTSSSSSTGSTAFTGDRADRQDAQPDDRRRIKVMSELDIAEKRIPQDGRFEEIHVKGRRSTSASRSCRRSTARTSSCGSSTRVGERRVQNLRLDVLGMDPETMKTAPQVHPRARRTGSVLVTGPTGSGRTTTLYACLSEIQSVEDRIVTIEDPVEYQLRGITRIPVDEKKGLTYAWAPLDPEHDPDKVMVGGSATADGPDRRAAALTGHLVFTTAQQQRRRRLGHFLDVKVEPLQLRAGPQLHPSRSGSSEDLSAPAGRPWSRRSSSSTSRPCPRQDRRGDVLEGRGCIECNGTSFYGRMAITELLDLSDRIRGLILDRRPRPEIKAAKEEGMAFLRESALRKVFIGETT